ncbi:hypothetical protein MUK42_34429 [Musa troglodytarum]|uniref:Uncharacterized protein n=1 Tax=Musa troglodytarum TaxID=320322 RepID=A0A9E7FEL6_9LILI|nr:hypothetical protein MUK42_34429 [Musa troglodytarum]
MQPRFQLSWGTHLAEGLQTLFSCNDGLVASKVGLLTEFRASEVSGESGLANYANHQRLWRTFATARKNAHK